MNRYWSLCAGVAVCLAVPGELWCAELLRGTVADRTGATIAQASVRLLADDKPLVETRTNRAGEFTLDTGACNARCSVVVAASGFEPLTQALSSNATLRLVLDVAPYKQSIEVQAATPSSTSTLDMSGVRESPAKDLGEALTLLDGVWKIRKAGIANDLVIRGFQQNNINVLVDGARVYAACPSHMDPPASHVDFAEVDHVNITKGTFDVSNAGSLGALVDIVTKRPDFGFHVKPSVSFGSFGFVNPSATASYGARAFQVLAGYSYRTADPYLDGRGQSFTNYTSYSAAGKTQRAYDIHTGWLEAYWNLGERQQLGLSYTRQQSGRTLYPYLSMDSDYDNADRAAAHYTARDLTATLRALRIDGYYTHVDHFMTDSQRTSAMMGQWMMAGDARSRTTGGRAELDLGRDTTVGVDSYARNWDLTGSTRMGGMLTVNPSIPDVNTLAHGAYVSYRRALSERLRLTAGARYDHAQMSVANKAASTANYYQFHDTRRLSNADNYASANAKLTYGVTASSQIFAGAGTTGRVPDAEERYISRGMGASVNVGDPLLPIVRNTEADAGWSLTRRRVNVRAELFYSWLADYILVNNQPLLHAASMGGMSASTLAMAMPAATTARSYTNVDARQWGGEAQYTTVLSRAFTLSGGASYTRGAATAKPMAGVLSTNLPELPPLRAWSALRYAERWLFAEFGAIAVDRQARVNTDLKETPTPGYALLNAKLGFTVRRVAVSVSVDNLANRFYYEHLSYYRDPFASGVKVPEPGRNAFAQVRYVF